MKHAAINALLVVLSFGAGHLMAPPKARNDSHSDALLTAGRSSDQTVMNATMRAAPGSPTNSNAPLLSKNDTSRTDEIKSLLYGLGDELASEQAYDKLMQRLLALAAVDPHGAVDYAVHHLKPPFQEVALTKVLGVWAGNDSQSAWDWVKTNKADDSLLVGTVLNEVGKTQPDTAWRFATELGSTMPQEAAGLYVSVINGMLYAGRYEDATRLLDSAVLPKNVRESEYGLAGFLAGQWAEYQPNRAAAWVLTLPEGGSARRQALAALGQSWAVVDPEGAANFAAELPPGPERVSMMASAVDAWFAKDPKQVDTWIAMLPQGADYDQFAAAIAVAPRIINSDPEASVQWAMAISDDELRMQSLSKVFVQWFQQADVDAMAYLTQMPPAIQSELRKRVGIVNGP
ncbi:MAG TPA: hypothetical protein VMV72_10830 [Verrucomicrobiae bacterium]|nr:hypothetical protein [Verrucomicrobiae bacterium]